jgi:arsenate reductase
LNAQLINMESKKKILVLCTGNSCRSQMVHGYLAMLVSDHAEVYSAGVEVHGLNPRAIASMKRDGIDISHHSSNHVLEYQSISFDIMFTVCDHAKETCPFIPGNAKRIHHSFPDPAKASGTEEEIEQKFDEVRDQIKAYCIAFIENEFN